MQISVSEGVLLRACSSAIRSRVSRTQQVVARGVQCLMSAFPLGEALGISWEPPILPLPPVFFCFVCVLGMRAICSLFNDPFLNTVQLPLPPRGC